ncbi:serine protease [Micromonospora chalcea]|uniref:S1 family peptidase n=1 Tax=Micromonospora chalcea TaxID=1874 RepID=UPI0033EF3765
MITSSEPWRLRIRATTNDGAPSEVLGTAFVVAPGVALTCAHVVEGRVRCWAEAPGGWGSGQVCSTRYAVPGWSPGRYDGTDVAVVDVPESWPAAPLGPSAPPRPETPLDALGFPEQYSAADDRGQRTRVQVIGPDETGKLIQVNGLPGFDGQIQRGYSGGPVVDVTSGRVVGMVSTADMDKSLRISWIIPLATLAEAWPPLADLLPEQIRVDPEFVEAVAALNNGAYARALERFNTLVNMYPREVDVYYYRVLAALGGRRPGGYRYEVIRAMENLLQIGIQIEPGRTSNHLRALWALIIEDYYEIRGIPTDRSRLRGLQAALSGVGSDRAREIINHVPAVECPTWQGLSRNQGI